MSTKHIPLTSAAVAAAVETARQFGALDTRPGAASLGAGAVRRRLLTAALAACPKTAKAVAASPSDAVRRWIVETLARAGALRKDSAECLRDWQTLVAAGAIAPDGAPPSMPTPAQVTRAAHAALAAAAE